MPEVRPTVSVIMNVWNGEKYVKLAIESVYAQTYPDWEIIFWDNASTDRTADIAKSYDQRLRYFRGETTVPLGKARNYALAHARGKYVAFLDYDDVWMPDKLELQIPLMEARPDVAATYGNWSEIDADGRVVSKQYEGFEATESDFFAYLLTGGTFAWQTFIIRRNVLEEIGGFRAYKISEDYDVLLRCAVSHTFVGIDRVLVQYRRHASNYSAARTARDSNEFHLRWVEGNLEALEIKSYWLANLPPQYGDLTSELRRHIADLHYEAGRQLCLAGNIQAGRVHLCQAWPESDFRWRAVLIRVLAGLLGARFYPRLEKLVIDLLRRRRAILGRFLPLLALMVLSVN